MPLHPQVSALLDSLRSAGGPPLETMTVAEARAAMRATAVLGGAVEPVSGAVLTAEYDPLRDEGEAYADRLRAAGVPVDCRRCDGTVHGFLRWASAVDDVSATLDEIGAALRDALEPR
jgi:acetyl esterase/lipase